MTAPDGVVGLADDTLAVFKGRVLDYAMKSQEVGVLIGHVWVWKCMMAG